jgi:hypothetical protein
MKSILNENEKKEIIERINKLTSDTQPVWGTMSVSQMLAHCTVSVKLAAGEVKAENNENYLKLGRLIKDRVFDSEMFTKNLPTSNEFLVSDNKEFEKNKNTLLEYIGMYSKSDMNGSTTKAHPFLGDLTVKEWGMLIWKHTNHHLTQFGV